MKGTHMRFGYIHSQSDDYRFETYLNDSNLAILNVSKRIIVSTEGEDSIVLRPYSICVAGRGDHITIDMPQSTEIVLLYFDYVNSECDRRICKYYEENNVKFEEKLSEMLMDEALRSFTCILADVYKNHLEDNRLISSKYEEFFFILCEMHDVADVAKLLHPAMSWYSPVFRRKVLDTYDIRINIKTLAKMCGYSIPSFTQKFQMEFHELPGKWLKDKKKEAVLNMLEGTRRPLEDISEDLGMSSPQQLSRYCKREFGLTPKALRDSIHENNLATAASA